MLVIDLGFKTLLLQKRRQLSDPVNETMCFPFRLMELSTKTLNTKPFVPINSPEILCWIWIPPEQLKELSFLYHGNRFISQRNESPTRNEHICVFAHWIYWLDLNRSPQSGPGKFHSRGSSPLGGFHVAAFMILCFRGRRILFLFSRFNYYWGHILSENYACYNFHYDHTFLLFVPEQSLGHSALLNNSSAWKKSLTFRICEKVLWYHTSVKAVLAFLV